MIAELSVKYVLFFDNKSNNCFFWILVFCTHKCNFRLVLSCNNWHDISARKIIKLSVDNPLLLFNLYYVILNFE